MMFLFLQTKENGMKHMLKLFKTTLGVAALSMVVALAMTVFCPVTEVRADGGLKIGSSLMTADTTDAAPTDFEGGLAGKVSYKNESGVITITVSDVAENARIHLGTNAFLTVEAGFDASKITLEFVNCPRILFDDEPLFIDNDTTIPIEIKSDDTIKLDYLTYGVSIETAGSLTFSGRSESGKGTFENYRHINVGKSLYIYNSVKMTYDGELNVGEDIYMNGVYLYVSKNNDDFVFKCRNFYYNSGQLGYGSLTNAQNITGTYTQGDQVSGYLFYMVDYGDPAILHVKRTTAKEDLSHGGMDCYDDMTPTESKTVTFDKANPDNVTINLPGAFPAKDGMYMLIGEEDGNLTRTTDFTMNADGATLNKDLFSDFSDGDAVSVYVSFGDTVSNVYTNTLYTVNITGTPQPPQTGDAGAFAIIFCIIAVAVFGSCSVVTRKKNEE